MYDVHFPTPTTGFAVGMSNTIFKSTDAGVTWVTQPSSWSGGAFTTFRGVYFTTAQVGVVVGEDNTSGIILKTTDGGSTWVSKYSSLTSAPMKAFFIDVNNGWAVGSEGLILKSSDAGETWLTQPSGTTEGLTSVHFISTQVGWAIGDNATILSTTNGGTSWIPQTNIVGPLPSRTLNAVFFADANNGWIVGRTDPSDNGTLLRTTTGGASWTVVNSGMGETEDVHFVDAQTGWIVGQFGQIRRSTDGGLTWAPQTTNTTGYFYATYFRDASTGWAVGGDGNLTTGLIRLAPIPPLSVTTSASTLTVCPGGTVSLSATVQNGTTPYSYTWAAPAGASFTSPNNASSVAATVGNSAGVQTYTITVADNSTTPLTSTSLVSITVVNPPTLVITSNPAGRVTTQNASLSLTASGYSNYVWLPAGNTPTITPDVSQTGTFPVSVTGTSPNGCSATASSNYTVVAGPVPPGITMQPATASAVCSGDMVMVTVGVSGSISGYQWLKDGSPVPGQTTATLSLGNVQPGDAGVYSLSLTGPTGTATSNNFTLSVNASPTVTLTFPQGSTVVGPGTGTATITLPANSMGTAFQAFGGNLYERLIIMERVNGYEVRQVDTNTTGIFTINRTGLFTITVTGPNGCKRTVQGVVQ